MSTTSTDCDVAVIGAGPYGLATAAHLRGADPGLEVRVFGEPMSFWDQKMPVGMLLRSPYVASNIADPDRSLTLDDYQAAKGVTVTPPVPLSTFVDYGRWFQSQIVPDLDTRWVQSLDRPNGHFRLATGDGGQTTARQVVIAAGIDGFARIPDEFSALGEGMVSHACEHRHLDRFAGQRVAVIGGGQSALESAALLKENGAEPEVFVRDPEIYYLNRIPILHKLGPITRAIYAPPDVGPAGLSRLVAMPNLYRFIPRRWHDKWGARAIRPAGAFWLRPRLEGIPMQIGVHITSARPEGEAVQLELSDGTRRTVDHILLGTGYAVDIARYEFLSPTLLGEISRHGGYPRLNRRFETSVPGLHLVGAPSAWTFGPLMRFVAGAEFAAPTVTKGVLGRMRSRGG